MNIWCYVHDDSVYCRMKTLDQDHMEVTESLMHNQLHLVKKAMVL